MYDTIQGGEVLRPMKPGYSGLMRAWLGVLCVAGAVLGISGNAWALPSFARQTGMQCRSCHTAYPQLTAFGREFKLMGYTMSKKKVPLYDKFAVMLQPSFTHTKADQSEADLPSRFSANDNFALNQASIFFGGKIASHVGGFVQLTYDGVGNSVGWDNTDFRFANKTKVGGKPLVYGIDVNNSPSVQDLWNTTPAWGWPFSGSGLAPGPTAATVLGGGTLAGTSAGVGAYTEWNDTVYAEVSLYQTLGLGLLKSLGVAADDVTKTDGLAPYWRVALQHEWGHNFLEAGTFGMVANLYPNQNKIGGSDKFTDVGLDMQYQYFGKRDDVTARMAWIHEKQNLDATYAMGGSSNASNHLNHFRANASYMYDKTYNFTVGYDDLNGNSDATYYGTDNGSPDSSWETFQVDWLPYNKYAGGANGFKQWEWFNPKLSLQYTMYNKFDGTTDHASDNNTLYLQAWLMF